MAEREQGPGVPVLDSWSKFVRRYLVKRFKVRNKNASMNGLLHAALVFERDTLRPFRI